MRVAIKSCDAAAIECAARQRHEMRDDLRCVRVARIYIAYIPVWRNHRDDYDDDDAAGRETFVCSKFRIEINNKKTMERYKQVDDTFNVRVYSQTHIQHSIYSRL